MREKKHSFAVSCETSMCFTSRTNADRDDSKDENPGQYF